MARNHISKKIRFEVFKRDSFKCQYCGRQSPDVLLEIDHIQPISKKGKGDLLNLITACYDCNRGKSNIELSEQIVLKKQQQQLSELQERREQLGLLFKWKEGLLLIENETLKKISNYWSQCVPGYCLTEHGMKNLKQYIRQFSIEQIMSTMQKSCSQYLEYDKDNNIEKESINKAFNYIPRIINCEKRMENNPELRDLYYIRGIIRNRYNYYSNWEALKLLRMAYSLNVSIDDLKSIVFQHGNWYEWKDEMEKIISENE